MFTESEARTKWCPFARALIGNGEAMTSANREKDGNPLIVKESRCIASECMAWQIASHTNESRPDGRGYCALMRGDRR